MLLDFERLELPQVPERGMVEEKKQAPKSDPVADPLAVARLGRLNVIGHRLGLAGTSAAAMLGWSATLPHAAMESAAGEAFLTAVEGAKALALDARESLAVPEGLAPVTVYADIISSIERSEQLVGKMQAVAAALARVRASVFPLFTEAESILLAAKSKRVSSAPGQLRVLDSTSYGLLIDARWLAAQTARMASSNLDPKQANADRVRRHRARQREGFAAVTTHYHQSDLDALRELGFLNHAGPYAPADIAAAFEAFQQAALAMVAAPDNDKEAESAGLYSVRDAWGNWRIDHWAKRMAALIRFDGRT